MLFLYFAASSSCANTAKTKTVISGAAAVATIKDTAKAHLINLITSIKINGAANKDFIYSVKYRNSHGKHQWANVFQMQNDSFKCVVVNPMVHGPQIKAGITILLSQNQVEDWMMEDKVRSNKFGNYTEAFLKNKH